MTMMAGGSSGGPLSVSEISPSSFSSKLAEGTFTGPFSGSEISPSSFPTFMLVLPPLISSLISASRSLSLGASSMAWALCSGISSSSELTSSGFASSGISWSPKLSSIGLAL